MLVMVVIRVIIKLRVRFGFRFKGLALDTGLDSCLKINNTIWLLIESMINRVGARTVQG